MHQAMAHSGGKTAFVYRAHNQSTPAIDGRVIVPKVHSFGGWVMGGRDETYAKREVAEEIGERLATLLAADPELKGRRLSKVFG